MFKNGWGYNLAVSGKMLYGGTVVGFRVKRLARKTRVESEHGPPT
jgi:hypothetical protein